MKIAKYYICKSSAYLQNGEKLIEARQKYRFIKKIDDFIFFSMVDNRQIALTQIEFKKHFKMKAL